MANMFSDLLVPSKIMLEGLSLIIDLLATSSSLNKMVLNPTLTVCLLDEASFFKYMSLNIINLLNCTPGLKKVPTTLL